VTAHLTAEQRQLALRLKARGLSLREIGPQVGCSHQGVALIARQRPRRSVRQDRWVPGPGRLTLADRDWSPPDRFIARRWASFVGPLRAK
jgi:Helix-turn-helix domain